MKYYQRTVTKREPINRFGKLGYVPYVEHVKTNDITPYNKGKRILFEETKDKSFLLHKEHDVVYSVKK